MICKNLTKSIAVSLLLIISQLVMAQDKVISGRVTDSKDGAGVPGVSVTPKGSRTGTLTSSDGSYRISIGSSVTVLVFSTVGYTTQEVEIGGRSSIDILLEISNVQLGEVVVTGYGTARKRDVTGSISSIKAKDFNQGIITSPDQLIQGKAAGVQLINNTGDPGGATSLRIRGISTIRSSNSPLIVIDGVPLSGGSALPGLSIPGVDNVPGQNPLNFINPADISSIDILKDASATAIYGSRGANGVIQITTKKGQSGAPKIEVSSSVGFSTYMRKIELLDASGYLATLQKYNLSTAVSTNTTPTGNGGTSVDALEEISETGLTTNQNVAISGGNETGRYRLSLGYLDQKGIVKESGFKKLSAGLNTSFKFFESKRLGLDINILTSNVKTQFAPNSNNAGFQGNIMINALQWNPTYAFYGSNGQPIVVDPRLAATTINPMALLAAHDDRGTLTTVLASISPSFKITNDLEYRFLYAVDYGLGNRKAELRNWINFTNVLGRGYASVANNTNINKTLNHTLSYNKQINDNLGLNAVAGYEYLRYESSGSGINGQDFVDYPDLHYYDYIQNLPTAQRNIYSFNSPVAEIQSYFGRATVNLKEKYILTATFRADGSSRFGKNQKYAYFPSVGFAWNVLKENFMAGIKGISNLKLRLGYGQTGNQEFGDNAAALRIVNIGIGNTTTVNHIENDDLQWEESETWNAGLDFTILNGRLSGTVDYFNKQSTKVINLTPVTSPGPAVSFFTNVDATIKNTGFEFTLNGSIIQQRNLKWNLGINGAFLDNVLEDYVGFLNTGELNGQGLSGAFAQRLASGYPVNVYYLPTWLGLDASGASTYVGGDPQAKTYLDKSPNPKFLLGINTDVSFKNWTFAANLNGAFGHYLYNNTLNSVLPIGNINSKKNLAPSIANSKVKEAISNVPAPSTRYLEKGDYLKAANATISYRIGTVGKNLFKSAVISLTGQNLFVLTDFTGFDPEVNVDKNIGGVPSQGIEYAPYPTARNIILGISFGF
jgi:iron complex outermembrane receptor protein